MCKLSYKLILVLYPSHLVGYNFLLFCYFIFLLSPSLQVRIQIYQKYQFFIIAILPLFSLIIGPDTVLCGSENLIKSMENPTTFCTIVGNGILWSWANTVEVVYTVHNYNASLKADFYSLGQFHFL